MLIDVAQLEWVAKKVTQESADVKVNAEQMNKICEGVEIGWKSQYTTIYTEELERVQENIYKVSDNLEKLAQTMNDIVTETKRIEAQNRAKIMGIK
ncbi:MAG: hypothetical protein RSD63_06265 [Eubacterium sp.]